MEKSLSCLICGGKTPRSGPRVLENTHRREAFRISYCALCGFGWTAPQPPPQELARYYSHDYEGYHFDDSEGSSPGAVSRESALKRIVYARRYGYGASGGDSRGAWWQGALAWFLEPFLGWFPPPFLAGGRLLDVGCATGDYMTFLRRLGWRDVEGIEFNPNAASAARKKSGFPVHEGTLDERFQPEKKFHVIVASHVLEHVPAPRAFLRAARPVLVKGGLLMILLPNAGSVETILFRSQWWAWEVPRHLWHFTPSAITDLLEQEGFDVEKILFPYNTNNILLSLRNFLRSVLWFKADLRWLDPDDKSSKILRVVFLPLAMGLAWLKTGGRMVIHARLRSAAP